MASNGFPTTQSRSLEVVAANNESRKSMANASGPITGRWLGNVFYLSLMCIYFGAIWINWKNEGLHQQKVRYDFALLGVTQATETASLYRQYTSDPKDTGLRVSYWYRHNAKPYVFVTTDPNPTTYSFEISDPTIIGCGFADPNRIVSLGNWGKMEGKLRP